jgi:DNA-binding CsgD family transcriptional regulator
MPRARADAISLVEAAYRLDLPERDWLAGLAAGAAPELDDGFGVIAIVGDFRDPANYRFGEPVFFGCPSEAASLIGPSLARLPPEVLVGTFGAPNALATGSQLLAPPLEQEYLFAPHLGVRDVVAFKSADPTGHAVHLGAPQRARRTVRPPVEARWARVAAHVAAALRLRRALADNDALGGEAVLDPNGHCAHAEGPARARSAREALRDAVLGTERARGKLRRTGPLAALRLWRALFAGRWSLVEQFDRDGRRFLIAHKNDPDVRDPRALSPRERQVAAFAALGHPQKLIAYELGLEPPTVAGHLRAAMAKLGARTRADLSRLLAGSRVAPKK